MRPRRRCAGATSRRLSRYAADCAMRCFSLTRPAISPVRGGLPMSGRVANQLLRRARPRRRAAPEVPRGGRRRRRRPVVARPRHRQSRRHDAGARIVRKEGPPAHPRDMSKKGRIVAQIEDGMKSQPSGAAFREGLVEADGFRIRYMEAGQGTPLVHLHGAGGMRLTPGYDLLCRHHRVVAFEMPGFGSSPENTRTRTMAELAATMAMAVRDLGIDKFNLMGTSFGAKVALWLAVQRPERVEALVLEAPAAIRLAGSEPSSGSPEEMARRLYAHPERLA